MALVIVIFIYNFSSRVVIAAYMRCWPIGFLLFIHIWWLILLYDRRMIFNGVRSIIGFCFVSILGIFGWHNSWEGFIKWSIFSLLKYFSILLLLHVSHRKFILSWFYLSLTSSSIIVKGVIWRCNWGFQFTLIVFLPFFIIRIVKISWLSHIASCLRPIVIDNFNILWWR